MQIKDLKDGMRKVNIAVVIIGMQPVREFEKDGKQRRVCDCRAQDDTGQIRISLWDDEIDKISVGDRIQITNGYVKEYYEELELSAGKFGRLDIIKD